MLKEIKKNIVEKINAIFNGDFINETDIVYPPTAEMGDLSLPCFKLAKGAGKSPAEVAQLVVFSFAEQGLEVVQSVSASGPYVNFRLKSASLAKDIFKQIQNEADKFGNNDHGKNKRVMVEFSNHNTHKELHIGHVRNISYGDAVNRILVANGWQSLPVSYINDFGGHVAKTIWALNEFYKDEVPSENKGSFLGKVYVRATNEMEENKLAKPLVSFIMKKIEAREGEEYKQWQETRQWSIDQFAHAYEELGVSFRRIFYESEFIDEGLKRVDELQSRGVLRKSDGAVIADLEEYKLGVLVVKRSDGTALYPVADIPLAMHKLDQYDLTESIMVVDGRQSLYFKQLFKLLEILGYKEKMTHLGYDVVSLPEGMMSSRKGNVITYEELRDRMLQRAIEETKARHTDWSSQQINEVARRLAIGAMKFEMLKVGADQVIVFDINKALDFSGFTAAYLQYTYARISSVKRKANTERSIVRDYDLDFEAKEGELLMKIAKFVEVIEHAGATYNPSVIAKYLFELAQLFNDYYHGTPILKSEAELRDFRLALLGAVQQVLRNGLAVLGIEVVEEM